MVCVALARGYGARHHVDARRAGGDDRGLARADARASRDAGPHRRAGRLDRLGVCRRRGAWRAVLWPARRPPGRKKLFLVTLGAYLVATLLTALSWDFASFMFFRALTG